MALCYSFFFCVAQKKSVSCLHGPKAAGDDYRPLCCRTVVKKARSIYCERLDATAMLFLHDLDVHGIFAPPD